MSSRQWQGLLDRAVQWEFLCSKAGSLWHVDAGRWSPSRGCSMVCGLCETLVRCLLSAGHGGEIQPEKQPLAWLSQARPVPDGYRYPLGYSGMPTGEVSTRSEGVLTQNLPMKPECSRILAREASRAPWPACGTSATEQEVGAGDR